MNDPRSNGIIRDGIFVGEGDWLCTKITCLEAVDPAGDRQLRSITPGQLEILANNAEASGKFADYWCVKYSGLPCWVGLQCQALVLPPPSIRRTLTTPLLPP